MSIQTLPEASEPAKGKKSKVAKQKKERKAKPVRGDDGPSGRRRASTTHASVNLLSPWVLEEIHVRRLRIRFVLGAVALLMLVGAAWGVLRMTLMGSEEDLRGERAVAKSLADQFAEMSDVRTYVGDVTVRTTTVEDTMADEIAFSTVLRELEAALPAGSEFTAIEMTLPPSSSDGAAASEAPACPGPDPFGARETVGCVKLAGTAADRDEVSDLVESLGGSKLFVEPFVDITSIDEAGEVTFSGTNGLDPLLFTNRYADVDGSEDDR